MNVNDEGGLLQFLLESANLGAQLGNLLVARVADRLAASLLAQGAKRPFVALASPLGQLRGIQPFLPEQRAYAAFFLCRLGSLYDRQLFGCGITVWLLLVTRKLSAQIAFRSSIMNQTIRVLLVEDSATDAELVIRELRRAGFDPLCTQVDTQESFLSELESSPDLILGDYELPQFDVGPRLHAVHGGSHQQQSVRAACVDAPKRVCREGAAGERCQRLQLLGRARG